MRDVHLKLTDEAFAKAHLAAEAGAFGRVEDFLADYIGRCLTEDEFDQTDSVLTPEFLEQVDSAVSEADSGGKTFSIGEVKQHFAEKSEAWKRDRAS